MKEIVLPKLEKWQRDVFDVIVEDGKKSGNIYLVKAKRQCGKSILGIVLLIKFALETKSTSIIVEPTLAQSRRIFKQLLEMLSGAEVIKTANATLLTMEFINGSEILFKAAEQEDNLRGMTVKNGCLIIDEGAFIKENIYEILYPTCDANSAPIIVFSTPLFMSGEYYKLYERGVNGESSVKVFDWAKYDTSKYLSKEKLEYYRKTVSPQKFLSEYLGEFIKEGSYIFGDISKCIGECDDEPLYCGIDWGSGNNGDFTALSFLNENGKMVKIEYFNNITPTEQIDKIAELINSFPSLKSVQVELNSIGRIYYDNLIKKVNVNIIGFTTTNESKRNIIESLITAFQTEKIQILNDGELIRELQHYAMEKTTKGYTYNGADGVHDDATISLALAWDCYNKNYGSFRLSII